MKKIINSIIRIVLCLFLFVSISYSQQPGCSVTNVTIQRTSDHSFTIRGRADACQNICIMVANIHNIVGFRSTPVGANGFFTIAYNNIPSQQMQQSFICGTGDNVELLFFCIDNPPDTIKCGEKARFPVRCDSICPPVPQIHFYNDAAHQHEVNVSTNPPGCDYSPCSCLPSGDYFATTVPASSGTWQINGMNISDLSSNSFHIGSEPKHIGFIANNAGQNCPNALVHIYPCSGSTTNTCGINSVNLDIGSCDSKTGVSPQAVFVASIDGGSSAEPLVAKLTVTKSDGSPVGSDDTPNPQTNGQDIRSVIVLNISEGTYITKVEILEPSRCATTRIDTFVVSNCQVSNPSEKCDDGIDNNNNGQIDEGCPQDGGVTTPPSTFNWCTFFLIVILVAVFIAFLLILIGFCSSNPVLSAIGLGLAIATLIALGIWLAICGTCGCVGADICDVLGSAMSFINILLFILGIIAIVLTIIAIIEVMNAPDSAGLTLVGVLAGMPCFIGVILDATYLGLVNSILYFAYTCVFNCGPGCFDFISGLFR